MPLGMGSRSWLLEDPLAQAQSPLIAPYCGDIQTSRLKKVGWPLEMPQGISGSQPGLLEVPGEFSYNTAAKPPSPKDSYSIVVGGYSNLQPR